MVLSASLLEVCFAYTVARGKGKKKKGNEETMCPVCSEKIVGTSEELNEHVDQCLKQVNKTRLAANWLSKRSAGVAPEVDLKERSLHSPL